MPTLNLPVESNAYRLQPEALTQVELELRDQRQSIVELRRALLSDCVVTDETYA